MWKALFILIAALLLPAVVKAHTWDTWRVGPYTTDADCPHITPDRECFWWFADGTTDSPKLHKHSSCSKTYMRRRGGSSPVFSPLLCSEDDAKSDCDIMETINKSTGSYGDVVINDTYWGAVNIPFQYMMIDPTSGSGFAVVGCAAK